MGPCRLELITTDEPPVIAKLFFDAIVVQDSQSDGCFPNPARPNESDGCEVVDDTNDVFDQLIASEQGPWRLRW